MAIFRGTIRSKSLDMDTGLTVALPYDRPAQDQQAPCKVVYLLHGMSENNEAWTRFSNVERYARDLGLALVMPEVQRSFYIDALSGLRYFTYVTEELTALCSEMFRISDKREDTAVAGLSMGGYGALRCGLSRPDLYGACASFSGALDLRRLGDELKAQRDEALLREFRGVAGEDLTITPDMDVFHLANAATQLSPAARPRIFMTCGEQDFVFRDSVRMKDHLESIGLEFTYRQWPGDHDWPFWDESVKQFLSWLVSDH